MRSKNQTIKVGISVGDINGIGLEIILKTFADKQILDFFTPVIYANTKLINNQANKLNLSKLPIMGIKEAKDASNNKINVVNIFPDEVNVSPGKPDKKAGELAIKSLKQAVVDLNTGDIDVLVTAPIDKDTVQNDSFKHPGHTEYLGKQLEGDPLMILFGDQLRVALVTQHIPLKDVSDTITKDKIIKKAKDFNESLKKDFYLNKPKIAVLGINPHSGDNGLIGKEEKQVIEPAIEQIRNEGILAFGPYPADSFFSSSKYKNFDGVLAMYHDQGLIPLKMLHFNDGVNFTAGLNKIRTSPDHGVAYDIAGEGIADESSFKEAIYKAIDIYNNRKQYEEDIKNPLPNLSENLYKQENRRDNRNK